MREPFLTPKPRDVPRSRDIIQEMSSIRRPPPETDDGWIVVDDPDDQVAPPFENGWDHEDPSAPVSFFVDPNGVVRIRGNAIGGTQGTTVFTLPVGFRPEFTMQFVGAGGSGDGISRIEVNPDGTVVINSTGTTVTDLSSVHSGDAAGGDLQGTYPNPTLKPGAAGYWRTVGSSITRVTSPLSSDTLFDAKGDLAAGTGADAAAKLTVGANNKFLHADSSQTTGLAWTDISGGGTTRTHLVQMRRATAAAWTSANPTLAEGEIGWETDTNRIKIGTGATAWTSLAYSPAGAIDANARVGVRKNSTGSVFLRRRLNFIEGSNVTITIADDSTDEEVDVTIASSGGGGGSVATDTIWDAKGDLAAGTGADTAAKLTVGANNKILSANSAQSTGLEWVDIDGGSA